MKIALDLDNTINGAAEFWSFISKLMIDNGHEVHVVTDRDPHHHLQYTKDELEHLNISYTKLEITGQKSKYCLENNMDFAVDDHCYDYYALKEGVEHICPYVGIVIYKKKHD